MCRTVKVGTVLIEKAIAKMNELYDENKRLRARVKELERMVLYCPKCGDLLVAKKEEADNERRD